MTYRRDVVAEVGDLAFERAASMPAGEEFTAKSLMHGERPDLSGTEWQNAGKRLFKLMKGGLADRFVSWKTSDNERHYRLG